MSNLVAFANERFTDTYATDLGHELAPSGFDDFPELQINGKSGKAAG
jgi:hypothetical protein